MYTEIGNSIYGSVVIGGMAEKKYLISKPLKKS